METSNLMCSLFFSVVGMGYCAYGRKQNPYFLLAGVILMLYPYFVSSLVWMIIIGIATMLLPYIIDWFIPLS